MAAHRIGDRRVKRWTRRRILALAPVIAIAVLAGRAGSAIAAETVNLDQWASLDVAWQNGNLNGNNSRYPEGGIVPFRVALEGLPKGTHTIHINYDFTAGGHKAYDFLATWSAWRAPKVCGVSGGGISSMCPTLPSASSKAFPSDAYVANGLAVSRAEAYAAASRRLTIWGGTIVSIGKPVHAGSVDGNSTVDFLVTFRSTHSAVLLAWGGHLAQSAFWDLARGGLRDGAGEVSGAPWHMRTLQLDGSGNKNQDRSIQPSAIVGELPPYAYAPPTPRPTPGPGAPGAPGGGAGPPKPTGYVTAPPTTLGGQDTDGTGSLPAALLIVAVAAVLAALASIGKRRDRQLQ